MNQDIEIKIIVDTNLWISFLIGRKLSCLLELLSYPNIQLVACQELIDEIQTVSSRPKFAKYYSKENLSLLWDFMNEEAQTYQIREIPSRCRDAKDDYLLELALIADADYLITGDKDLLEIGRIGSCQILTVMEFDALSASMGHATFLHEDMEEYLSIVIE